MRMTEIQFPNQPPIESYGPGGFRVGGAWREGSLLLMPAGLHAIDAISQEALAPLVEGAGSVDVVLVGQGPEIAALPLALRVRLEEAGLGVEVMSTPSACRTYNVLLSEGRRVAAILTAM